MNTLLRSLVSLSCLLVWGACSAITSGPGVGSPVAERRLPLSLPELGPGDVRLAAVGDIADCRDHGGAAAKATAALLAGFPDVPVITPGDLAYRNATPSEFARCYTTATGWGGLKERTRPAPGNHDYGIYAPVHRNNAVPYFEFFGANAGPAGKGFYSFDLGSWHIVSLNSMAGEVRSAPTMAEQLQWLREDLAATQKPCILAFWHHPLFSSGEHGQDEGDPGQGMEPLWQALYDRHADVIVNGHDHHYEQFSLQNPQGKQDPRGLREFVVGTGGADLRRIEKKEDHSEAHLDDNATDHGALFLTLRPDAYEWTFVRTDRTTTGETQGSQDCHEKPAQ